jgi:hypothetical protein
VTKSRDASFIVAQDLQGALVQLNFLLARISDRLDKLEGLRDSFESKNGGNFEGAVTAHSVAIHDDSFTDIHALGD